jgi:hypothetical protein
MVDTLASGVSERKLVEVQVLSQAQINLKVEDLNLGSRSPLNNAEKV